MYTKQLCLYYYTWKLAVVTGFVVVGGVVVVGGGFIDFYKGNID